MSGISTHVLDTTLGSPAAGMAVRLERKDGEAWTVLASDRTDEDGRCRRLLDNAPPGRYRLIFATGDYLQAIDRATVFPEIEIAFQVSGGAHYHLPLLLAGNGYTTYRGS